jgi:hypothetical protein
MFYSNDPQDSSPQAGKQKTRPRSLFISSFGGQRDSISLPLRKRILWAVIIISPLLLCSIIFLSLMFSTYNTQIAMRLPVDELTIYIGEMFTVGAIILATIVLGLLGVFKMKWRRFLYGAGVILFIALMIVYESFISSSNTIYSMQPHLEITQTGFSPAQMSIFTDDNLQISNTSDNVAQTLFVSSSTNSRGIPAQLLRPGLTLQPGQSVNLPFSSEGTFVLTSSTTPGLTLTITVTETSSGGGFNDFSQ